MARRARKPLLKGQYLKMLLLLIVTVTLLGSLANIWLTRQHPDTSKVDQADLEDQPSSLQASFQAAVNAMQAGDHEQAIGLWHPLLIEYPQIPEIKVNMGFSLFELGRYPVARDFFLEALEQNPYQANAYYGLAICEEKLGDLELALGSMRSYIHLASAQEDPQFIRRARSALWEWEAALKNQKDSTEVEQDSEPSE